MGIRNYRLSDWVFVILLIQFIIGLSVCYKPSSIRSKSFFSATPIQFETSKLFLINGDTLSSEDDTDYIEKLPLKKIDYASHSFQLVQYLIIQPISWLPSKIPRTVPDDLPLQHYLNELEKIGGMTILTEYSMHIALRFRYKTQFNQKAIREIIINKSSSLTASQTAEWLWMMHRFGFSCKNSLDIKMLNSLVNQFSSLHSQVNSRDITRCLVGMTRLGYKWDKIHLHIQSGFIKAISLTIDQQNDREMSNVLYSCSKMNIKWVNFPNELQLRVCHKISQQNSTLANSQGSMTLYALGMLGFDINQQNAVLMQSIENIIESVLQQPKDTTVRISIPSNLHVLKTTQPESASTISKATNSKRLPSISQQVANSLYGLCQIKLRYKQLSEPIQQVISKGIHMHMVGMNDQEVANTLYSLGKMEFQWSSFNIETQQVMIQSLLREIPHMVIQGLTNALHGISYMGFQWTTHGTQRLHETIYQSILLHFHEELLKKNYAYINQANAQSISNIINYFHMMGQQWDDLPINIQSAFFTAMDYFSINLKTPELSAMCYGLGQLNAPFEVFPLTTKTAWTHAIRYSLNAMTDQDTCSILNGLAKMNAKWDQLDIELQNVLWDIIRIRAKSDMASVCLSCIIHSLKELKAQWTLFPEDIRSLLCEVIQHQHLHDQTLASVIFGLGALETKWTQFDEPFRSSILKYISSHHAFREEPPQHIANTIWGLAKMDCGWSVLPQQALLTHLTNCQQVFKSKEIVHVVYGLALMDASWDELTTSAKQLIAFNLKQRVPSMNIAELSSIMDSMAVLAYDADYTLHPEDVRNHLATDSTDEKWVGLDALWRVHATLLDGYRMKSLDEFDKENYDQLSAYFQFMSAIDTTKEFVLKMMEGVIPTTSGPCATVPSRLHSNTMMHMMRFLSVQLLDPMNLEVILQNNQEIIYPMKNYRRFNEEDDPLDKSLREPFTIQHEFVGVGSIFPMDSALYLHDEVLAFIEIDGDFHYRAASVEGQKASLRRKDRLKEFLYKIKYPNVSLYRIRADQVMAIGPEKAGEALAKWIVSDVKRTRQ